jgi:DNA mismatch endonuclease (patch repair protein)
VEPIAPTPRDLAGGSPDGTVLPVETEASWASSPARRRNMQANRSRDTQPEIAVRRLLHASGLRYRVDVRPVPSLRRRADIVFTRKHIAVFIDGCFWHGCPEHGTREFKTNAIYWTEKIARNTRRDLDTAAHLEREGWTVLRYWEHVHPDEVVASIEAEYRRRS